MNNQCPECGIGSIERQSGDTGVGDESGNLHPQPTRLGKCNDCGKLFEPTDDGMAWRLYEET